MPQMLRTLELKTRRENVCVGCFKEIKSGECGDLPSR